MDLCGGGGGVARGQRLVIITRAYDGEAEMRRVGGDKKKSKRASGRRTPVGVQQKFVRAVMGAKRGVVYVVITSRGHREVDVHGNRGGPRP